MVKQLLNVMSFYTRFLLSFSHIGFMWRRLFWSQSKPDYRGQTWLVTGASGGIGKAVVEGAVDGGAKVIAVARSEKKLQALKQSLPSHCIDQVEICVVDLSLQGEVRRLLDHLASHKINVDVLINNVGVLLDDLSITDEGVETSFATNLLNHYLLTQVMLETGRLAENAVVVNVTSGGMYNAPLSIEHLDIQTDAYNGVVAYAFHKRGQAVLTQYWRKKNASNNRRFYAVHPGWADTQGVKTSLPTFRKILKSILRDSDAGADSILWLVSQRPGQLQADAVWFDRKPRKAHCFKFTRQSNDTAQTLVNYLQSRLIKE